MLNRRQTGGPVTGVVALAALTLGVSLSVTGCGGGGSSAKPAASPHSPAPVMAWVGVRRTVAGRTGLPGLPPYW